jgi:hypothetical protein
MKRKDEQKEEEGERERQRASAREGGREGGRDRDLWSSDGVLCTLYSAISSETVICIGKVGGLRNSCVSQRPVVVRWGSLYVVCRHILRGCHLYRQGWSLEDQLCVIRG